MADEVKREKISLVEVGMSKGDVDLGTRREWYKIISVCIEGLQGLQGEMRPSCPTLNLSHKGERQVHWAHGPPCLGSAGEATRSGSV